MITRAAFTTSLANAGRVRRYHTWPSLTQETVASHGWRVATIYCEVFGLPRAEVLYHCLVHDGGELVTGDPPYPVKRNNPKLKSEHDRIEDEALSCMLPVMVKQSLSDDELAKVKVCDVLQMWEHGVHEHRLGNQFMVPIINDCRDDALRLAADACCQTAVLKWMYGRKEDGRVRP